MNSLSSIVDSVIWYVIFVIALIILTASFSVLLRSVHDKRKKAPVFLAFLNFILSSFVVVVIMDCGRSMHPLETGFYSQIQKGFFELPYYLFIFAELISFIFLVSVGMEGTRFRSNNLTSDTLQDAIDALPEGVSIGSDDGMVRLSNLKINNLCRFLTGKVLTDTNKFWAYVEKEGKEQGGKYLLHTAPGEVWLFEKEQFSIEDKTYDQITATEVTERYAIIEELEKKNEHLQDIRKRMKAVSELSGDMFVAQVEADARAALHNQLGQVLLMGRHYINHPDVTDPKIVHAATLQMNQFLLGEAKEPYEGDKDALAQAVSMANSIGVRVEITGPEPGDEDIRKILSQAVTECAANTVKHAEGDKVTVAISGNGTETVITITNNGKPPKCRITESGGLLSLRRNVETIGGVMELDSDPEFRLRMRFK